VIGLAVIRPVGEHENPHQTFTALSPPFNFKRSFSSRTAGFGIRLSLGAERHPVGDSGRTCYLIEHEREIDMSLPKAAMPADLSDALSVIDGLTGSRTDTTSMLFEGRMLGNLGTVPGTRFVQAGTASSVPWGSGGPATLPRGAIRLGSNILTASDLLNQLHDAAERSRVADVMQRFGLDRGNAANVLAARAYVWAQNYIPVNYRYWSKVPYSGPVNERVAAGVMRYERAHPGTAGLASRGDAAAIAAIDRIVDEAVAAAPAQIPLVVERTSAVSPTLSASSTRARTLLSIMGNQRWQAHHLVPFAVVAGLPVPVQQAIAASGWKMDSVGNLIALPANMATYVLPPNLTELPFHNGSQGVSYDNDVRNALGPLVARATALPPRL